MMDLSAKSIILLISVGSIFSATIQNVGPRQKRQNIGEFFDTFFNQARTSGVGLYNVIGGLIPGLSGGSSNGSSPVNALTQGATSLLMPLVLSGVAAGNDARHLLQRGGNTGSEFLRSGLEAFDEGSKLATSLVGTSLAGAQNLTNRGGDIFRNLIPSLGRGTTTTNPLFSLLGGLNTDDDTRAQIVNKLVDTAFQVFRFLLTGSSKRNQSVNLGLGVFNDWFRPTRRRSMGNPIEENEKDFSEKVDAMGRQILAGRKGVSTKTRNAIPR